MCILKFIRLISGTLALAVCSCADPKMPANTVLPSETLAPRELERQYTMHGFSGKHLGSDFTISRDGSNTDTIAAYIASLPAGPFIHEGRVSFYAPSMPFSDINCQRQRPFSNRPFPGSQKVDPLAVASNGPPPSLPPLWREKAEPPPFLQFHCDLDSGNGLYWGHILLTFILRRTDADQYQLVFYYAHGTKHSDDITFPDLDGDGNPEVWMVDRAYGNTQILIERADLQGIYRRVFQYDIYQGFTGSCYGYDGNIQLVPTGGMPDLLLIARPLFNEEGGCYPAAETREQSSAMIRNSMERIRGTYRFTFGGYGYKGDANLQDLHLNY
ncbi:MAG: hypothetical protein CMN76_11300 [Spirochaetaceae bacterium]|nr:hypothetical protein [Spirochaetaceae bacterium]